MRPQIRHTLTAAVLAGFVGATGALTLRRTRVVGAPALVRRCQ
jgi:hypothetical protein